MLRILKISLFLLFVLAVMGLMGFIYVENSRQPLNEVVIRIERETEKGFLEETFLLSMIEDQDSVSKKQIKEINTQKVEDIIQQNVFVETVDAYVNLDKDLIINVRERIAVMRIFPKKKDGFYIDQKGNMFPLSKNYTSRVMVANGYLDYSFNPEHQSIYDTIYKKDVLRDLFKLTNIIGANPFLSAQISQIYVNSIGEYDLIPEIGNHIVQMGTIDNAEEKLNNLDLWYRNAMLKEEWNKYKIINIKYKDQVVCTQK